MMKKKAPIQKNLVRGGWLMALLLLLFSLLCPPLWLRRNDARLKEKAVAALSYCRQHGMNTHLCILVDYSLHSGRNRLFIWDFRQSKIVFECPAAHGRGHERQRNGGVTFSNVEESWLSSKGKCRISERYDGQFGTAYRLDGLESTNSQVRQRCIVLHSYKYVPTKPIYPFKSVGSKGCVMVSPKAMQILDHYLKTEKNVLLDIFD